MKAPSSRVTATPSIATRLRLRITAAAETAVRAGHPWVFSDSVLESNRAGQTGELAVIYDRKDRFLAVGLFDPGSPIRVRILHAGKPQTIDRAWWQARLEQSLARRRDLFDAQTTGYRLIHGESDGWPGLVLDRYDTTLVLKLYTAAWLPRLDDTLALLREKVPGERVVLRLSRNLQATAEKQFQQSDGKVIFSQRAEPDQPSLGSFGAAGAGAPPSTAPRMPSGLNSQPSTLPRLIFSSEKIWLYHGNCLELLDAIAAKYPDGRFDAIFADPPYFLPAGP